MFKKSGDTQAIEERAALDAAKERFGWRGIDDIPMEERRWIPLHARQRGTAQRQPFFYALTRPDMGWPQY